MNYAREIAAMFGLKINEEFEIITNKSMGRFRFTDGNSNAFLEQYFPYDRKWHDAYLEYLEMIIQGTCQIERLRGQKQ